MKVPFVNNKVILFQSFFLRKNLLTTFLGVATISASITEFLNGCFHATPVFDLLSPE